MALLLYRLRYLGYFLAGISHAPKNVRVLMTNQRQLLPIVLANHADRDETRRKHLLVLMQHLDFRRVQSADRKSLIAWLGERALEKDRPSLLLQHASDRLYQLRLVRPAITTMEELAIDAR